jgi:hypothetical protein
MIFFGSGFGSDFEVSFRSGSCIIISESVSAVRELHGKLAHSGTMYMGESVLEKVTGHKLLLYAHFSTYFDQSYTIVKVSPLGLQNGFNNWSIFGWAVDFKHRRHFIISFHHPSLLPPTLVTIAYVRIMRACHTSTSLTPGEEGGRLRRGTFRSHPDILSMFYTNCIRKHGYIIFNLAPLVFVTQVSFWGNSFRAP